MKNLLNKILGHIEYLKTQPHETRRKVAFGAAAAGSGFIALVWLAGSLATGAFALKGNPDVANAGQEAVITVTPDGTPVAGLAGAAAALQEPDAPAHIEIVDTTPKKEEVKQPEKTILPF